MAKQEVKQESRVLVRIWISFWFHDMTRLVVVGMGAHLALTIPLLYSLGVTGEALRQCTLGLYMGVLLWAMADNDYSNLRRIGLDEYRKPLMRQETSLHKPQTPVASV